MTRCICGRVTLYLDTLSDLRGKDAINRIAGQNEGAVAKRKNATTPGFFLDGVS